MKRSKKSLGAPGSEPSDGALTVSVCAAGRFEELNRGGLMLI